MTGKRIELPEDGSYILKAGEYGKDPRDGIWYACAPDGLLANLANHKVIEHEDGTITVSPSILVSNHTDSWHGYLLSGIWSL